ncbi:MAG TPA: hypothetical protein VG797_04650, partial [Phycisphaerales bacterium]|nr:hypothetical protein [Phycisphaerales bacterium]
MLGVLRRSAGRNRRSRRGTIVLLALAFLALISISALAYVAIVRTERSSSTAFARERNFQQQVTAVVSEIQAVLTADLFGNKIVTPSTPQSTTDPTTGRAVSVWPRMFEDGEMWDYPYVNTRESSTPVVPPGDFSGLNRQTYTFAPAPTADLSDTQWANARLLSINQTSADDTTGTNSPRRFLAAFPDDAWLAPFDPIWDATNPANPNPNNARAWSQITNLRSAFRFVRDTNGDGLVNGSDTPSWQRGDGMFADLSQFFQADNLINGYANPGANLLVLGPQFGSNQTAPTPDDPNYTGVFQFNMAQLGQHLYGDASDDQILEREDEALWIDTDGDNRPDARWTQLGSLGDLYGLKWVVATRIVDASALINVNTALEFSYDAARGISTGETPADIDLYRLLRETGDTPAASLFDQAVQVNHLEESFLSHIQDVRAIGQLVADQFDMTWHGRDPFVTNAYQPWGAGSPLSTDQKSAYWRHAGVAPDKADSPRSNAYPSRDMIDLFTFSGTNHYSLVSKMEERFDGPEGDGYLPGQSGAQYGPMLSRQDPQAARSFTPQLPMNQPTPTREQLYYSARRYLTAYNGVGTLSPVPALNQSGGSGTGPMLKIGLRDFITWPAFATEQQPDYERRKPDLLRRTFAGLVWALAPLSTDGAAGTPMDMTASLLWSKRADIAADPRVHYGGDSDGLGWNFSTDSATVGAGIALLTAAALTVNIADSIDGPNPPPAGGVRPYGDDGSPTMIRIFNDQNPQATSYTAHDGVVNIFPDLPQGKIFSEAMPTDFFGAPANPTGGAKGVTVIGMEHQLYLSEVTTLTLYSDDSTQGGNGDGSIDPSTEVAATVVVVHVANPWPVTIESNGYRLRIPVSRDRVDSQCLVLSFDDGRNIPPTPEGRWFWYIPETVPASLRDRVRDALAARFPLMNPDLDKLSLVSGQTPQNNAFADINPTNRSPVLLSRVFIGTNEVIVDRLSPPLALATETNPDIRGFPGRLMGPAFTLDASPMPYDNIPGGVNAGYFNSVGYAPTDSRRATPVSMSGRIAVWSSVSRPGTVPTGGGMPAYVIESSNGEKNRMKFSFDASVWLSPYPGTLPDTDPAAAAAMVTNVVAPADGSFAGSDARVMFQTQTDLMINPTAKPANSAIGAADVKPFQLMIANGPMQSVAEIGCVSAFAHTYRNEDDGNVFHELLSVPMASGIGLNLQNLRTAGEWLWWDIERDHQINPTAFSGFPNPHIGTLDFSRYNMRKLATFMGQDYERLVPDSMAVPLATRVFDVFDAAAPIERLNRAGVTLTQGRVNINTAPARVMRMLPFLAPTVPIGASDQLPQEGGGLDLIKLIRDYRDGVATATQTGQAADLTGLPGLRVTEFRERTSHEDQPRGFTTTGELAILGAWNDATHEPESGAAMADKGFLYFGASAGEMGFEPFTSVHGLTTNNDAEERLGVFHGLADTITTRSDVYVAWFVLRGYDPKVIEGIQVGGAWQDAMNSEAFRPAYESRWLVVFDRSNVRRP